MSKLEKEIFDLNKIIQEQASNIEHLKEGLLWINEDPSIRLGHLKQVRNIEFLKVFPEKDFTDEHYYTIVFQKDDSKKASMIEYVKESELDTVKDIIDRSGSVLEYSKMTTFISGAETYITTLMT